MVNYSRFFNGRPETCIDESMATINDIGTPQGFNNYPWGWAQVGNTPGKRYKQNTHGGGIRDPLIVHWPQGISEERRHPSAVSPRDGYRADHLRNRRRPPSLHRSTACRKCSIHGTSLAYAFAAGGEGCADHGAKVQYFEMFGHRGIWASGWKAVTWHEPNTPFDSDKWELYHLDKDFSECKDLAKDNPEKLQRRISAVVERGPGQQRRTPARRRSYRRSVAASSSAWANPRNQALRCLSASDGRSPHVDGAGVRQPYLHDHGRDRTRERGAGGCVVSFGDSRSWVLRCTCCETGWCSTTTCSAST